VHATGTKPIILNCLCYKVTVVPSGHICHALGGRDNPTEENITLVAWLGSTVHILWEIQNSHIMLSVLET